MRLPFLPEPRGLVASDMEWGRIPRAYHKVTIEKVPDLDYRPPFLGYYQALPHIARVGKGLILLGPFGSGKTALGVCCLKRTLAWGGSVLFILASELPSVVWNDEAFDDDWTMEARAVFVDLLLLDDIGSESRNDAVRGCIETLLRKRVAEGLATVITSNLTVEELQSGYPALMKALQGTHKALRISGMNWRDL